MNAERAAVAALLTVACAGLVSCGARGSGPTDREEHVSRDPRTVDTARSTTTDDAVAAAVRFVCSGQRLLDTSPADLGAAVRSMWSAPSADDALRSTLERLSGLRDRLGDGTGPTRFRQAVLAVRVHSSSQARVVVSLWWVGVLSRADAVVPQAQWSTSTVTMVAEADGWKVDGEVTEVGPTPDHSVDSEPISHTELERRLTGFVDWGAR